MFSNFRENSAEEINTNVRAHFQLTTSNGNCSEQPVNQSSNVLCALFQMTSMKPDVSNGN